MCREEEAAGAQLEVADTSDPCRAAPGVPGQAVLRAAACAPRTQGTRRGISRQRAKLSTVASRGSCVGPGRQLQSEKHLFLPSRGLPIAPHGSLSPLRHRRGCGVVGVGAPGRRRVLGQHRALWRAGWQRHRVAGSGCSWTGQDSLGCSREGSVSISQAPMLTGPLLAVSGGELLRVSGPHPWWAFS